MKKHFVTFYSPGTFVSEETTMPIDSWDIETAVSMSKGITERYESRPFAFTFTTRERGDQDLDAKVTKRSGRYYLGGRVLTLAEVRREMPNERILISNMVCNKWDRIIVNSTPWRMTQPLGANDVVLTPGEWAIV